jgi:uncharacterized protein HemY
MRVVAHLKQVVGQLAPQHLDTRQIHQARCIFTSICGKRLASKRERIKVANFYFNEVTKRLNLALANRLGSREMALHPFFQKCY